MGYPKRVMHFTPYFPPHTGGLEMYVKEWSMEYAKRDTHICVVTFFSGQDFLENEEENMKIIVLPAYDIISGFPFPLFFLPSFWRALVMAKRWSPEIIHTHTRFFLSSLLGGIFAKFLSVPWIHIEHGSGFVVSRKKIVEEVSRLYDNTLGKWVLRHADKVVTVSKTCERFVRETFLVDNAVTIYRGILPVPSSVLRSEDEIIIGYVGRLTDLKGINILIESFARVISNYRGRKRITLKIVGDGEERGRLGELVQSLGIVNLVEFLGKKDNIEIRKVLLPSFHIFVNPSFQEGLPTTVIEAILAGCEVIATDVGGTREIHEGYPFMIIPSRDTEALTHALHLAIDTEYKNISKPDESFFSWDETFEKFSYIYKEI